MKTKEFVLLALSLSLGLLFLPAVAENRSKIWDVAITTEDGHELRGTFWQPPETSLTADVQAVILIHQLGGSREDWGRLPSELNKAGYGVLSVELRGHGSDEASSNHWSNFEEKKLNAMVQDVKAARKWLQEQKKVHINKIAIVGARLGANLALKSMKEDDSLQAAFCLSPGFSYRKVRVDPDLTGIQDRPLYFVAAEEDHYSVECLQSFEKAGARTKVYPKDSSADDFGTQLIKSRQTLVEDLTAWLEEVL